MNKDSVKFGLLLSTVIPIIIFAIFFLIRFNDVGYVNAVTGSHYSKLIPKMLSLSVFPNGLIFYYYIGKNFMKTMKGMVTGTEIMAVIVLIVFLCFRA